MVNGVKGEAYDAIKELIYSPDSKAYAFTAKKGKSWFVVMNGKPGPGMTTFSSRCTAWTRRLAYMAQKGRSFIVEAEKEGPWCDVVTIPIFSPDSRRVMYMAKKGEKWSIFIDGKESRAI